MLSKKAIARVVNREIVGLFGQFPEREGKVEIANGLGRRLGLVTADGTPSEGIVRFGVSDKSGATFEVYQVGREERGRMPTSIRVAARQLGRMTSQLAYRIIVGKKGFSAYLRAYEAEHDSAFPPANDNNRQVKILPPTPRQLWKSAGDSIFAPPNGIIEAIRLKLQKEEEKTVFLRHVHDFLSAEIYIGAGQGWILRGDKRERYKPGDYFYVGSGRPHGFEPDGETVFVTRSSSDIVNLRSGEHDFRMHVPHAPKTRIRDALRSRLAHN